MNLGYFSGRVFDSSEGIYNTDQVRLSEYNICLNGEAVRAGISAVSPNSIRSPPYLSLVEQAMHCHVIVDCSLSQLK